VLRLILQAKDSGPKLHEIAAFDDVVLCYSFAVDEGAVAAAEIDELKCLALGAELRMVERDGGMRDADRSAGMAANLAREHANRQKIAAIMSDERPLRIATHTDEVFRQRTHATINPRWFGLVARRPRLQACAILEA
jgi:hypothetical protein